jgi:CRISPR type I-E-associated protein CasB/Cse2
MSSPAAFIASLQRLGRNDLGKVATLRRSLSDEPGEDVRAFPMVERHLPTEYLWDRQMYYLVAGLWATINTASVIAGASNTSTDNEVGVAAEEAVPTPPGLSLTERGRLQRRSFGRTVAQICEKRGDKEKIVRGETTSTERRFITLLDADDASQLAHHLRQMVQLVRAEEGLRIFWIELLTDLRGWNSDERYIQRKWARAFYQEIHSTGQPDDGTTESPNEGA